MTLPTKFQNNICFSDLSKRKSPLFGDFRHRKSLEAFLAHSGAWNLQILAISGTGNRPFLATSGARLDQKPLLFMEHESLRLNYFKHIKIGMKWKVLTSGIQINPWFLFLLSTGVELGYVDTIYQMRRYWYFSFALSLIYNQ